MTRKKTLGRPQVLACPDKPGAFRWTIRLDAAQVVRSPYAFATRDGAAISADLWLKTLRAES